MVTGIQYALQILAAVEQLAMGIPEILSLVKAGQEKLQEFVSQGRDPTDEEWAALDAQVNDLLAKLKA